MRKLAHMADLIAFPFRARAALVRALVDDLHTIHGEAANAFWRQRISALVSELRASGLTDAAIRREILDLQDAVQCELVARSAAKATG